MIKFLVAAILVANISNVFAVDLTCALISKGREIPVSADAVKLAKALGVKTCNKSARFKAFAKSKGYEIKTTVATEEQENAYNLAGTEKIVLE